MHSLDNIARSVSWSLGPLTRQETSQLVNAERSCCDAGPCIDILRINLCGYLISDTTDEKWFIMVPQQPMWGTHNARLEALNVIRRDSSDQVGSPQKSRAQHLGSWSSLKYNGKKCTRIQATSLIECPTTRSTLVCHRLGQLVQQRLEVILLLLPSGV